MALTTAQKATLKTAIQADSTLNEMYVAGNYGPLADALNAEVVPAFVVWRTSVSQDEIMLNGFDWVRVDNLTIGKARIWEWLFVNDAKVINPSKSNVRAGIDEVWKGTAADLAVRAAVYTHCKRNATVLEKIFATGTGTDVSPATMTVDQPIGWNEIGEL